MGTIYLFEHPGQGGGTWYAAEYPLGATRYYRTEKAREDAVSAYVKAIDDAGGVCYTINY